MAYIDTSVLVACYCPETFSRAAQRETEKDAGPTISQLAEVEMCSALSTKMRTRQMNAEDAHRVLACFRMHCSDGGYRIVPIEAREYAMAAEWIAAFTTPLRTLDALHLAAAFSNRLILITADKGMAVAARHFGVPHKLL
jgi:predicted nucleic acid-binding protein